MSSKKEPLSARVEVEIVEKLKAIAADSRKSLTDVVSEALAVSPETG